MTQPDLGDQLARILASLEKATPQMLELATHAVRFEAAANGLALIVGFCFCVYMAVVLLRWARSRATDTDEVATFAAYVCAAIFLVAAIVLFTNMPDQLSRFCNARYYAVVDLLACVKP